MKKIPLIAVAAFAFAVLSSPAKAAIDYPYCLSYVEGWSGIVERCDFSTLEQCRMSAGGLNGSCDVNRRYLSPIQRAPQRRSYRDR